ncbi:LytR C-terminal domain-containing protein [Actinotalea subterranea]|uniref:LytR C-terminal domain-containing protein n=1 Tax=Actinotalea subterranea TaxID=2607497 RepID=UPI0011EBA125|nr:LytR C-terminal domain-containing protein [Actinotalea subterranea]
MSARDYPHPPDEFDAADVAGGPRGAHRRPRSRLSRWLPFLVVLVVFPALAYGIVTWLSDWEGLPGADTTTTDTTDTAEDEPATDDTATEETPADGATTEETPAAEPTVEAPPPPVANLATPVEVFNATSRSGLAGGAADRLEEAGFTSVEAGNWDGADLDTSVVYYPNADHVATAQAAAAALGLTAVQESAEEAPEGIVVVLAADYRS